jgi:hypothetical protein
MERVEKDATPAEEWLQSLNATCNRLSTQYLNLLRAASSVPSLETGRHDPRAGGGHIKAAHDPPPPPLAADVALSSLQCQLATENICAATSQLLSLIRTLRLSLLLMDDDTIQAEEELQVRRAQRATQDALRAAARLEQELMELRMTKFNK